MEEYRMIGKSDISEVLTSITKFVRNTIRFIVSSVKRYWLTSFIVFAAVLATGIYYTGKKSSYYVSDMACVYNHLHKKTYGEMVRKLNILAQTGSYRTMAGLLNIPVEQVKTIISLEAQNIAGAPLYEDISQGKFPFYIVVKATTPTVYKDLQPALLHYLNNAPFQVLRNKLEQERLNQKIAYSTQSIRQIDSIVAAYPTLLKEQSQQLDTASNVSNMLGLISYRDRLVNTMLTEQSTMQTMISVELLHGFTPTEKPVDQNRTKQLISLLLLAIIAASIAAALKHLMNHDR